MSPNRWSVSTGRARAASSSRRTCPDRLVRSAEKAGGVSCFEHWSIRLPPLPPTRTYTSSRQWDVAELLRRAFDDGLRPSTAGPWYQTGQLRPKSNCADQIVSFPWLVLTHDKPSKTPDHPLKTIQPRRHKRRESICQVLPAPLSV
jgi:hypothetical protein